jgi:hypothetical protein
VDIRLCLALNNLGALKLHVASAGGVSPKGPGRIRSQLPTRLFQFHTELLPCIEPIAAALVAIGADQPFDIGVHRDPPHGLHDSSQKSRRRSSAAAQPAQFIPSSLIVLW